MDKKESRGGIMQKGTYRITYDYCYLITLGGVIHGESKKREIKRDLSQCQRVISVSNLMIPLTKKEI